MKLLSLFNPKNTEDLKEIKQKISAAKTFLTLLRNMYVSKRINEIDRILDSSEKYDKPGYDRYISGLLRARLELKKIHDLLTFEETK